MTDWAHDGVADSIDHGGRAAAVGQALHLDREKLQL